MRPRLLDGLSDRHQELVHHLPESGAKALTVVQAMGSVDSTVNIYDAQEIGRVLVRRLGGSFLSLNTPAFKGDLLVYQNEWCPGTTNGVGGAIVADFGIAGAIAAWRHTNRICVTASIDQVSFEAPDLKERRVLIDRDDVHRTLAGIIQDEDLSRYIL